MSLPKVAIIGRPNVGKSTLFNRLIRKRLSIVDSKPGVTRDRLYGKVRWGDADFLLIDTGGLVPTSRERLLQQIRKQVELSIEKADAILFVVDGKEGVHYLDEEISHYLRKSGKFIILVVNKVDITPRQWNYLEFYRLGFSEIVSISATHGLNINELLEKTLHILPKARKEKIPEPPRIMIAGHPNVGKSTLINRILGEERVIVNEKPGTTRDIIEVPFFYQGEQFILLDTAGIRREGRIKEPLEKVSVKKTKRAIGEADLVLFLLDITVGVIREDLSIASLLEESGKPIIILLNKCDLLREEERALYMKAARDSLHFLYFVPFLFISALTGKNLDEVFKKVKDIIESSRHRLTTEQLDEALKELKSRRGTKRGTIIYSLQQVSSSPNVFVITTNNPKGITQNYQRFIRNYLYEKFLFEGIPLKIKVKGTKRSRSSLR
ncbi:MAG TPA: ribosome biogenesis GTPase Der [Candidatus Omnitrophica bacterium]|nr:ribosome biogenesis GTPase Der [Candidatus Omnitrophota bacterium]